MQVGRTRIIIRPAMMMIFGGIALGIVGIAAAGRYALGPQLSYGIAHPKRWSFGTKPGTTAELEMQSDAAQKRLMKTRTGYGSVDAETGFSVRMASGAASPDAVYLRNTISVDAIPTQSMLTFSFDAKASAPRSLIVFVRDAQVKEGGALLWSHTFPVNGDWKEYAQAIPAGTLSHGRLKNLVATIQLGGAPGDVSFRRIYLK